VGVIGNRYLQGEPTLPYAKVQAYPNTDVFLDLEFLDHTGAPVVPTAIIIELDDITNCTPMTGPTTLTSTGSTSGNLIYGAFAASMTLQVAAAVMQMSFAFQGSQVCQLKMQFTAVDSVTGQPFNSSAPIAIIELCADASVSGF
jgi:hypothetical protein